MAAKQYSPRRHCHLYMILFHPQQIHGLCRLTFGAVVIMLTIGKTTCPIRPVGKRGIPITRRAKFSGLALVRTPGKKKYICIHLNGNQASLHRLCILIKKSKLYLPWRRQRYGLRGTLFLWYFYDKNSLCGLGLKQ